MAVIEMHSSWLAINSIIGCTNNCKYCLLQATNDNRNIPKALVTPKTAVKELLNYKYYDLNIPVCLLPNTDAFLNEKNISYLLELLKELDENNVRNDLVIITKCKIAKSVISFVKHLKSKGQNVVFYISYSGLGKDIEPNITENIVKNNFKILKENDIDVIHYFRPFLPSNSEPKRIQEILDFVHQYTDISVTTGLALIETFIDRINCWNEIKNHREQALKANCVWPEQAWNYFNNNYSHVQQVFQTNTCGLNAKLKRPSFQYYNTMECKNYNHCSLEQRQRCMNAHRKVDKFIIKRESQILLEKLGFDLSQVEFIFDKYGGLELKNIDLKISDASYLSYKLGLKVYISTNNKVSNTYNSSLNGARPLILKEGTK